MPVCSVFSCKNRSGTSSIQKDNVTFHLFPKDMRRDAWIRACDNHSSWTPKRTSTICSQHFETSCFEKQTNNRRKLKPCAVPTLKLPKDEGSPLETTVDTSNVPPITNVEDDEQEVEMDAQSDDDNKTVIQDPLSQSAQASSQQLHSHQPSADHVQLYLQPSTSTTELVIKEEIDDEDFLDYKAMYYKLLEQVAVMKRQQLLKENQAIIESKEMENLIKTNRQYVSDMQHLMTENQRLKEKNQSLTENIKCLSDKIQELTEKKDSFSDENNTKERVNIFSDYIEKIENLKKRIRSLEEEIKSLTERNETLTESMRKHSEESRSLQKKNKMQRRYIQRLKNNCDTRLESKCKVIKALRRNVIKLKNVNAKLQRMQATVDS